MAQKGENLYVVLDELGIAYQKYEHPPVPTIEEAIKYWREIENTTFCKNLFFRNHKGNRHYLVVLEHSKNLAVRDLEQRLRQGKISFASPRRLTKYLGLQGGSVSPFGLVNDMESHVHVFFDANLQKAERLAFHPNINTATLIVPYPDFMRFMNWTGNSYEMLDLY